MTLTWAFPDEANDYARQVIRRLQDEAAIVPRVWSFEAANVLIVGERRGRLSRGLILEFLELLKRLAIAIHEADAPSLDQLLAIGWASGTSAYDAAYLELASRRGLPLATLDRRLRDAAQRMGIAIFDPH